MSGLLQRLPRKMSVASLARAVLVVAVLAVTLVGWPAPVGLPLGSWVGAPREAVAADATAGVAATGAAGTGLTALPAVPAGWRELVNRRHECSKRYVTDDGQLAARIWAGPVHYRDAEWRWQDISNRLVPDGSGSGLVNEANSFKVWLARRIGGTGAGSAATGDLAAPAARFSYGSAWFALSPESAADASAVVAGSSVTYPNVYPGVDLRYEAGNTELKELVVLRRAPSRAVWKFRLAVDHLRLQEDVGESIDEGSGISSGVAPAAVSGSSGGRLGLYSTFTGRRLARFGNLIMHDSATNRAGEPAQSSKVGFRVELVDGRPVGVLSADAAWLADPKRVYPVYIDPTITKDAIGDTYISSAYPSNNYDRDYADSYYQLKCGYYSSATGTNHTLIKFSIASLYGVRVTSANLKMYCEHSYYATTDTPVWCNRATEYWSETGSNWSGRPSSSGLTSDSVRRGNWASFGVTGCVQNWTDKTWDNYGFVVHEGSYGAGYWKKFRARENSSGTPYLQVSYAPGVKVTAPNGGFSGEWLTDPQPTFSWKYSSPEPQQKYRVQAGTSSTAWDASTVLADSGDMSSRDATWAPSAPLPDGKLYWRVRGYDGAVWSSWDTGSFRLDANGPVAGIVSPAADNTVSGTVTVTAFADDTAAAAGSRTATGTAAGGVSGAASVTLYSNWIPIGEDTVAPYTFSWGTDDELNGPANLRVVARDRAGNESQSQELQVEVDNPLPPPVPAGYLRDWIVLGPFDGSTAGESEGARLAEDYLAGSGGESNIRPSAGQVVGGTGPSAGRTWKTVSSATSYVDLSQALAGSAASLDRSVVYAAKYVKSGTPDGGELWVGSNDGVKVWMNGEPVHSYAGTRAYSADEDKVEVGLEEGWNLLLFKLSNATGGFGFGARLCDMEGAELADFGYGLSNPLPARLLAENFNSVDGPARKSAWNVSVGNATSPGSVGVEDGEHSVRTPAGATGETSFISASTLAETDYACNVDVGYQTDSKSWGASVLFRATDVANGYVVRLGGTGSQPTVSLAKRLNGVETALGTPVPFTPRLKPAEAVGGPIEEDGESGPADEWESHHARIEVRGAAFRVFVDGVSVLSATDAGKPLASPGRVGALVIGSTHVHFDNLVVEPLAGVASDPVVSGTLRGSRGEVLGGVEVLAVSTPDDESDPEEFTALTDSNGNYALAAPADDYSMYVDEIGLDRQSRDVTLTAGSTAPRTASFSLQKAGAITGRVTDGSGGPIPGAVVMATGCDQAVGLACSRTATADASGYYVIGDLDAPAEYALFLDAEGYSSTTKRGIEVATGTVTSTTYVGPGAVGGGTRVEPGSGPWRGLAGYGVQAIDSAAAAATSDATLGLAGSISGTVVDEYGNPVEGALVVAEVPGNEMSRRSAQTDDLGAFSVDDLDAPADYDLTAWMAEVSSATVRRLHVFPGGAVRDIRLVPALAGAYASGTVADTCSGVYRTHEWMVYMAVREIKHIEGRKPRWYKFLCRKDPIHGGRRFWQTVQMGVGDADRRAGLTGGANHFMQPDTHQPYPTGTSPAGTEANTALVGAEAFRIVAELWRSGLREQIGRHNQMLNLGEAVHYVQDLRVPHHAALAICVPAIPPVVAPSPHSVYEDWVRDYTPASRFAAIADHPVVKFSSLSGHYNDDSPWGWVDRSAHTSYYGTCDGWTYWQWTNGASLFTDDPVDDFTKTFTLLKSAQRHTAGFILGHLRRTVNSTR